MIFDKTEVRGLAWAKGALFFALMANVTGQTFLFVILPALARKLGFSDIQAGGILSLSALVLILAAPFWGYVSEHIGRRPVLLAALIGAALAPVAYSLVITLRLDGGITAAAALTMLFAARGVQAVFVGGLLPSAQAYIADVTTPEMRAEGMGLIGAAYGLGAIGGAALAWLAGGTNPALGFLFTSLLVGLGFSCVYLFAKEPPRRAELATNRGLPLTRITPFVAITLIAFTSYSTVQQVMVLRLQDAFGFSYEHSISKAGIGLLFTALAVVVTQGFVVRVLGWRPERLLVMGSLLGAATMLICGFTRSYGEILGVLVAFGVALGLIIPGNLACLSLRAGPASQGKAAGISMMGQGLGLAAGPVTGAALYQISPMLPFAGAALLLLIALLLSLRAAHRNHET